MRVKINKVMMRIITIIILCVSFGCSNNEKSVRDLNVSNTRFQIIEKTVKEDMIISFHEGQPNEVKFNLNQLFDYDILKDMSYGKLGILRNSIYAKYGYIFSTKEYEEYFLQFSWYTPTNKDIQSKLSHIDKENINNIVELENKVEPLEYKNDKLGFSLTFPESWKGKYSIKERDNCIVVYFRPNKTLIDIYDKELFLVIKNPEEGEALCLDNVQFIKLKGNIYLFGGPTDSVCSKDYVEADKFFKMESEVPEIIKTFR